MELDPTRTAVIAVHLQKDIVYADGAFGGFFAAQAVERDVVAVNSTLLDAARRAGATVVYTRVAWQPRLADLIVTHQRVGGFSASQLDHLLRSRDVDTVLFAGVATNFSVEGTARQASDLGYRTVIVADACSAADPATHDASIASLGLLAEITTSAEVLDALSVNARG